MRRRSVLLGLGTAAAGSGIAFGSGAFTQVQASRDVTIGIDEDSDALLALEAESNIASVSNDADTGELYIDTNQITGDNGNEGFNSGAQIQIGETSESFGDTVVQGKGAFTITNNFETVVGDEDDSNEIDIGIDLSDLTDPKSDLEFVITVYDEGGSQDRNFRVSPSDGREVITDVAPNEVLHVAIFLDTASVSDPEDFDGEVVISAGPSLGEDAGFPTDDELIEENQIRNVNTGATFNNGDLDTPIQDAVNDASSFETLRVGSGTYNELVTIDTEGLTLEGAEGGDENPEIESFKPQGADNPSEPAILVNADNVTINSIDAVEGIAPRNNQDVIEIADGVSGTTLANLAVESPEFAGSAGETGEPVIGVPTGEAIGDITIRNVNADRSIGLVANDDAEIVLDNVTATKTNGGEAVFITGPSFGPADVDLTIESLTPQENEEETGGDDLLLFGSDATVNGVGGNATVLANEIFDQNPNVDQVSIDGEQITRD